MLNVPNEFNEFPDKPNPTISTINCEFHCRQALSNMTCFLKPNGTILMIFVVTCPAYNIYESLSNMPRYKNYMADMKRFISPYHHQENPRGLFQSHVEAVGLKAHFIQIRNQTFFYDNVDQLRSEYFV